MTPPLGDGLTLLGIAPIDAQEGEAAAGDPAMRGAASAALYGPDPERFWPVFSAAPEYADGRPDPVDRWSRRVGGALAAHHGGVALYPFEGPPYYPFLSWAFRSGRAHPSPIGFAVHERLGLWFSVRLAILSPRAAPPTPETPAPCEACADKPCLSACPVGAFGAAPPSYDIAACGAHLETAAGAAGCMTNGCAARAACPLSRRSAYPSARAALHMTAFRAARRRDREGAR